MEVEATRQRSKEQSKEKVKYRVKRPDEHWFRRNIPCQVACPVHTDIPNYIAMIAQGRFDLAYEINQQANLFPEILGRICARPCEAVCRRGRIDQPVAICALKRAAADFGGAEALARAKEMLPEKNGLKVAIVGAGPAGLAAAHDLALLGYSVVIFEALPVVGGMLNVGIPPYRLPREVTQGVIERMKGLGVEIRLNTPVGKDIQLKDLMRDYHAVLIAAGAHKPIELEIPGEDLAGVIHGVTFMRQVNLGEIGSLEGKQVAVIGGGFTALDCARSSVRLGAKHIFIVYRRTKAEMAATMEEIEEAEEEGIKVHCLASPVRILSDDGRKVSALECIRNRLGEPDESGRPRPVPIEGSNFLLKVDMVIPAISQAPDISLLPDDVGLEISRWRRLVVDPATFMTDCPGVFAVGDFVTGPRDVIRVIADGRRAAASIDAYLRGEKKEEGQEKRGELRIIGQYSCEDSYRIERQKMPTLPPEKRTTIQAEVELGYTREQAIKEAQRCLQCQYNILVDEERCILCGECVNVCPEGCIKIVSAQGLSLEGLEVLMLDEEAQGAKALVMDEERCVRCGLCVNHCPTNAIAMACFSPYYPASSYGIKE